MPRMTKTRPIKDTLDLSKYDMSKDVVKIVSRRYPLYDPGFEQAFRDQEYFMSMAFDLAKRALKRLEVPVGCVIVYRGKVIAKTCNDANEHNCPARHAEVIALKLILDEYQKRGADPRAMLRDATCYVTLEPCMMCASALQQMRIGRIFFGATNYRFGGIITVARMDMYDDTAPTIDVVSGMGAPLAVKMLQVFYANENMFAPEHKRLTHKKRVIITEEEEGLLEPSDVIKADLTVNTTCLRWIHCFEQSAFYASVMSCELLTHGCVCGFCRPFKVDRFLCESRFNPYRRE